MRLVIVKYKLFKVAYCLSEELVFIQLLMPNVWINNCLCAVIYGGTKLKLWNSLPSKKKLIKYCVVQYFRPIDKSS